MGCVPLRDAIGNGLVGEQPLPWLVVRQARQSARQGNRQGNWQGKARKSARQLERHCCYGERGRMIIKFFPLFGFRQQGSWVGGAAAQRRRGSTV